MVSNRYYEVRDDRWDRIKVLSAALNPMSGSARNWDYVVWVDPYAVFLNVSFRIEPIIEAYPGAHIIGSAAIDSKTTAAHTGFLIFKNSKFTRSFLDRWWGYEDEDMEGAKGTKKKEVWDESKAPLQDGEELVFDNSAYQMLHRAKVEWPCLSIDVLVRDRIGEGAHAQSSWFPQYVHGFDPKHSYKDRRGLQTHKKDKFPYTVYFCAGSQSLKKSENKIYVNKWSDMCRTLKDDQDIDSNEEDDEEEAKDPIMRFECIPHRGCVNRIRSLHGTGIVATWNDENDVGIYDVTQAVEALDAPVVPGKPKKQQSYGGTKLASFKHTDEGYALDWSPLTWGRLAAGCCNSQISLYIPADENCSSFIKEVSGGL